MLPTIGRILLPGLWILARPYIRGILKFDIDKHNLGSSVVDSLYFFGNPPRVNCSHHTTVVFVPVNYHERVAFDRFDIKKIFYCLLLLNS